MIPYNEFQDALEDLQENMPEIFNSWRTIVNYVDQEEQKVVEVQGDDALLDERTKVLNDQVYSHLYHLSAKLYELVEMIRRDIEILDR